MMEEDRPRPRGKELRGFLVALIAALLLIWGPIDESWPFWLWIRTAYLIAIPAATWGLLVWIWRVWQPDDAAEDRLVRTIAGALAGGLLVGAVLAAGEENHYRCTQVIRTRDGEECVGDYELVPGPDLVQVVLLIGGAAFAFWYGVQGAKDR